MKKVKSRFKVNTGNYYNPVAYRTRTVEMELPVDEHGFTLPTRINDILKEKLSAEFSGVVILNHQIVP